MTTNTTTLTNDFKGQTGKTKKMFHIFEHFKHKDLVQDFKKI